ncbi:MAG: hypothetical protein H0V17_10955 [Deltaproteobacteria bacterium]|nr:hypothetical protein [Deltaproteobacteria bacterium]
MKLERLFHVLVVFGGASSAACNSEDDRRDRRQDPAPDATNPVDGVDGAAGLQPCFCDVQVCCDRTAEPAQVVDGFECCWSTTCP